jgi:hypothetical protein
MGLAFKRNQLEWALWQLFTGTTAAGAPPKVFRNRIKRLLDLDRDLDAEDALGFGYAFFNGEGPGLGTEVEYSTYSAFALAIGLDLLDAGFKQSEVVELCRACKPKLRRYFTMALKTPPVPAEHVLAEERAGCPTYRWKNLCMANSYLLLRRDSSKPRLPQRSWFFEVSLAKHFIRPGSC